jgi:hypothetical protein
VGFGWDTEPDLAQRLRILATAYDPGMRPELLVDYAAIRLLGMAAHIESQIRTGNPAFTVHRDHQFAAGYRAAAAFILTRRDRLLGSSRLAANARVDHGETKKGDEHVQRIAILGASGAGKTVIARQLGQLLGLPVTHLDQLRYDPDWNLVPEADFAAAQRQLVAGEAWIADGNTLASLPIRAARRRRLRPHFA